MAYKPNKATKEDFHKHLIPNDSSYCVNMNTKEDSNLVGLKVKITSNPFEMEVKPMGKRTRLTVREFVFVEFKGVSYMVLNDFKKT